MYDNMKKWVIKNIDLIAHKIHIETHENRNEKIMPQRCITKWCKKNYPKCLQTRLPNLPWSNCLAINSDDATFPIYLNWAI